MPLRGGSKSRFAATSHHSIPVNIQSLKQDLHRSFVPLLGGSEQWHIARFIENIKVDIQSFHNIFNLTSCPLKAALASGHDHIYSECWG